MRSLRWTLLMAWRDSRRNRSRLLLFVSSIILGIAALVAIYSLGDVLRSEIDEQAAGLLGADLEISGNKPIKKTLGSMVDSLGDRVSEQKNFSSMIYFPKNGKTRLIEVKALSGDFPYYSDFETTPATAARSFRKAQQALVDKTLMLQFDAKPGDSVKIGQLSFEIAGSLSGAPGMTGISASVAPVVYIPMQYLPQTGLEQKGSRMSYRMFFKYDKPVNLDALADKIGPRLDDQGFNYDTVETKKRDTSRSFSDVIRFLSLIGFIALLLGCIGVASAIHIYVREKINTIAVLRCLGAKASQAFFIYLVQITAIGLIGSIIGAAIGSFIQVFLPVVLKDFLPLDVKPAISWTAIGQGLALGLIISILFALLPLVSIRKISPLNSLRVSFEHTLVKDGFKWLIYALILAFIIGFAYLQLGQWMEAIVFSVGILISFLSLMSIAALLTWMVRRFFPSSWSYVWRQGLANLYRPNNQTAILIVSIGLGTALVCTMFFIQQILLNRVTLAAGENQPNMVLFDIQAAQRDGVIALARSQGLPATGTVPIVNMRLEAVNDITSERLKNDTTIKIHRWAFNREYRVTYRDSIINSEKIVAGKFTGNASSNAPPGISIEQRYAKNNDIKIGDTLVFNVQGATMKTIVSSFREVDWNRVQTNFLVVFPKGVLEKAPQFHVLMTHVPSVEVSARFQSAMVKQYPNVSIIDLGLILAILDEIMDKIGFVIRFMAGFSMITGVVVLIASVLISKYQRVQESVLLRTLGSSRRQIFIITALEYFFLGALAAITGIVLAMLSSWALAHYIFETSFTPQALPVIIVFVAVSMLTVAIGLANSRFIVTRPPLEILRQEG
jgi:putative ABC transport system permease protein